MVELVDKAALLKERMGWSLSQKIDHSLYVIESFVSAVGGVDYVYVSFSGGKDSTVLYDLCRRVYPNILGVFCNTGNEWPEVMEFVHKLQGTVGMNIQVIRPKLTPREVWERYGFPLVSKEVANKLHKIRHNPNTATAKMYMGDGYYSLSKQWRYLIDVPYGTSHMCCEKLKKGPFKSFESSTGRRPLVGIMAVESKLRRGQWIRHGGCNVFGASAKSAPLSIWLEEDIWAYIKKVNLPIADVYYKGASRTGCVGCGFGAHMEKGARFHLLHSLWPRYYKMVMNYTNNGVSFREAMGEVLRRHGGELPDEVYNLFSDL